MKTAIIQCALNAQKKFKGFAYLFNGTQYVKYDWNKDRPVPGYPKNLSVWNLPGNFAHGVDAAINGEKGFEGFAYFFKGNEYVKYDWDKDQAVTGYPKALSLWKLPSGFENGIDAAFNGQGKYQGFGYMFKNGEYIKYDWANDRPVPGYPKPLSAWDLPVHFRPGSMPH